MKKIKKTIVIDYVASTCDRDDYKCEDNIFGKQKKNVGFTLRYNTGTPIYPGWRESQFG